MSQHHFVTHYRKKPVVVTMGWDRPLGHFFMFVEWHYNDAPPQDVSDAPVYSTLNESDESKAFATDWNHIKEKLVAMGIEVPASMFNEIERDRNFRVRNREIWHKADGSFFGDGDE